MCSFLVWKNACLNYREFDLEGDLVRVPHTWYLSTQSFITLLKPVWREYDIVAMNEWKKKCVGLQWTWVSKHTVAVHSQTYHQFLAATFWFLHKGHIDGILFFLYKTTRCVYSSNALSRAMALTIKAETQNSTQTEIALWGKFKFNLVLDKMGTCQITATTYAFSWAGLKKPRV